jgi:hypothetical protein
VEASSIPAASKLDAWFRHVDVAHRSTHALVWWRMLFCILTWYSGVPPQAAIPVNYTQ